jgi:hypothetical protein
VISPLLANVYLHYSFDLWVNVWRQKWQYSNSITLCGAPPNRLFDEIRTPAGKAEA